MTREMIEHRERMSFLQEHLKADFFNTGHLHVRISDAMEKYHQAKLKLLDFKKTI